MGNKGFTLLETMIAVAIMTVAFGAILMMQSSSLTATERARQMNVVTMLAKGAMVDAEIEFQGRTFGEVDKEKTGAFKEPYEIYSWKREIKELKFPEFKMPSGDKTEEGTSQALQLLTRLITNFLSKSAREVTVTVSWKRGKGEQNYAVSTYWVDLNHEFTLNP